MIKLMKHGAYLLNGSELIEDNEEAAAILKHKLRDVLSKEESSEKYHGLWHFERT